MWERHDREPDSIFRVLEICDQKNYLPFGIIAFDLCGELDSAHVAEGAVAEIGGNGAFEVGMCDCHLLAAFLSHLASGLIQFLPHVVGERHPGHQADHLKTAWKNLCSFLVWFDSFAAIVAELIHQIDGLSTLRALHVVYGN